MREDENCGVVFAPGLGARRASAVARRGAIHHGARGRHHGCWDAARFAGSELDRPTAAGQHHQYKDDRDPALESGRLY